MKNHLNKLKTYSTLHEGAVNLMAPIAVGSLFGFASPHLLLTVLGSYLVDIDHILHCFLKRKFHTKDIISYLQVEFIDHRPHIYLFHIIEVLALFFLIASIFSPQLSYLFIGFAINIAIDMITYFFKYRSLNPWFRFFFGTYNLYYLFRNRKTIYERESA